MTGNLFYGNTASNAGPVVYRNSVTLTSNGYNVSDATLVTGIYGAETTTPTDTTFATLGITGDPFNTTTFEPVTELRNVLPSTAIANFPATDFNGNARTWPGAPGAVK
jgi:hypothetical protein